MIDFEDSLEGSTTSTAHLTGLVVTSNEARQLLTNSAFLKVMKSFEADRKEAIYELTLIDAEDPKKIRELQNTIYRHDELTARLSALIVEGDIAQAELSDL